MRNHEKLRAFELADHLMIEIYSVTRYFPRDEMFGLTSQLRRASLSVPSNIVEGCARLSEGEYLKFLSIAHGSAREVEYQLSVATRLGYMAPDVSRRLTGLAEETSKVLNGLIHALKKGR